MSKPSGPASNANVTLGLHRGEVSLTQWDPYFQARLEAHMDANPDAGGLRDPDSLFNRLLKSHRELVKAVEEVLGEDGIQPFTITLKVDGQKPVYTSLY